MPRRTNWWSLPGVRERDRVLPRVEAEIDRVAVRPANFLSSAARRPFVSRTKTRPSSSGASRSPAPAQVRHDEVARARELDVVGRVLRAALRLLRARERLVAAWLLVPLLTLAAPLDPGPIRRIAFVVGTNDA